MQKRNEAGMTLVQRGGLLAFALFVGLVLMAPSGYARRTNIQGGDDAIRFFTNETLTATTPVTSTVKIPVGNTEGLAVLFRVEGLTATNTVTLTRLERIRANETMIGYPVEADTGGAKVITTAGEKVYSEPFTEGIEYIYYKVESSESGVKVNGLSATQ